MYTPLRALSIFLLIPFLVGCYDKAPPAEAVVIRNPILPGFNPDPSVCRVGDDYYLVTSTFEYFPGLPIYHSRDLVRWEIIGHAIHRPEQIDMAGVPATQGLYAPTIRFHDGVFYVINTLINTNAKAGEPKGNFVVTATDPAGPWSDPHWIDDAPGIDPSLFFDDDGKVYYCGNRSSDTIKYRAEKDIWIQELDLSTFQLKGPRSLHKSRPYYEDESLIGSPLAMEAPHIYKKDGVYYLLVANGGTGMGHAASIWKSDRPTGPWELNPANPILTHRGISRNSGICCTGHVELFETAAGDWWAAFLAVRGGNKKNVMGRETFLEPVDWSGTWPVINPADTGRTSLALAAPAGFSGEQPGLDFRDEFSAGALDLAWTMLRTPDERWWALNEGQLELTLRPDQVREFEQPSFLGIRVPSMTASFETATDFRPAAPGDCAGLAFFRGHQPSWTLVRERGETSDVVAAYYLDSLLASAPLPLAGPVRLKVELADFAVSFSFAQGEDDWQPLHATDGHELGFPPAGRFTGAFAGPYASCRGGQAEGRTAAFAYYAMTAKE